MKCKHNKQSCRNQLLACICPIIVLSHLNTLDFFHLPRKRHLIRSVCKCFDWSQSGLAALNTCHLQITRPLKESLSAFKVLLVCVCVTVCLSVWVYWVVIRLQFVCSINYRNFSKSDLLASITNSNYWINCMFINKYSCPWLTIQTSISCSFLSILYRSSNFNAKCT